MFQPVIHMEKTKAICKTFPECTINEPDISMQRYYTDGIFFCTSYTWIHKILTHFIES